MDYTKMIQETNLKICGLHVHVNRNLFETTEGDKIMKFKEIKHLISKNNNKVVIATEYDILGSYVFNYKNREVFYKAFLEDTTFDTWVVVGIEPNNDEYGYVDGITIIVE